MDSRMLNYLERKMEGSQNRRDVPNRRNEIGFTAEHNRSNESYFEDDDFDVTKQMNRYTTSGGNKKQDHEKGKASSKENTELIELMRMSFKKELCDVLRYCKMAEIAEEEGLSEVHEGLKELCHDEFTHAKFFKMGMRHFGEDVVESDEEVKVLWKKAKKIMEDFD